jgi:hypothetical protein
MTLNFSVNGEQIDAANATYRDGIPGGQYHVFQEKWTVPEGLTADPLFTFAIIPGDSLAGDDTSDNFASLSLPLARPDLAVGQITALGADGGSLKNGFACELFAAVYNYGTSPAIGAELRFMIDGTTVAPRTVDLPAPGAATVTVPYTVTGITDDTPVGSAITGISGSASLAGQGSLTYAVTVDPRNLVSENSETNNSAGPLTLPVTTGTSRGIVQVQVKTLGYDNISGATVTISASGRTASATTDSYGYCSFLDVPFGSYEVLARKSGYNDARSYDEILYEGNGSDYVCLYMDNYSYVSGVVTAGGTGLADVTVTVDGTSLQTKTNASGGYTLKVPVGAQLLKFRCVGYARSDKPVTVAAAQTTYMNVTMSATDLAYVYGWVMGTSGEDLPGMKVEAYRADGTVLATVYTGLDGRYDLNVPLYAPYTEDIGVRVTGQGLSATQGLFLHQGLEMRCDISFVPAAEGSGDILASVEAKVAPWTEFQYIPSTFWTEGVDISVIFGSFKLDTFVMATNSFIEHLDISPRTSPGSTACTARPKRGSGSRRSPSSRTVRRPAIPFTPTCWRTTPSPRTYRSTGTTA